MYIEKLKLQNVKLIRDQTIDFMRGDKPRMWTVLVGENGTCKTTILQAIALVAVGPDASNRLAEGSPYADRRVTAETTIEAVFGFGSIGHSSENRSYPGLTPRPGSAPRLTSTLQVSPGWDFFLGESAYLGHGRDRLKRDDPLRTARSTRQPHWLVAGYGTTRALPVPKSIEKPVNAVIERLSSLFGPTQIVGTGFADIFGGDLANRYSRTLKSALLKQDQVLPRVKNLELRGKHGVRSASHLVESHRFEFEALRGGSLFKIPATWLSQGYQAMIAWIADVVGQFFWDYDGPVGLEEMEGLVLIDELDIHLHPTWQLGLIRALKATFPRVQFVATTHTAMVLPGLEADEVLRTRFDDEGNVVVEPVGQSPSLMTGSEIFNTFFGIDRLYPTEAGEALYQYGYLASNPHRSDAEESKLQKILQVLKKEGVDPGWQPTPRNGRASAAKKKRTPRKPKP